MGPMFNSGQLSLFLMSAVFSYILMRGFFLQHPRQEIASS